MRQLFSYYDNKTLIFATLILIFENLILKYENTKPFKILTTSYLYKILYIILFREIYSLQLLVRRNRFSAIEYTP